jgi:uncharacterized membrane protein
MKIEFHPDFNFHIDLKVIWPRIAGAFKGLKFNPDNYQHLTPKVAGVIFLILLVLALVVLLIVLVHTQ